MTTAHELWMHVPKAEYNRIYSRGYDAAKRRFELVRCKHYDDNQACFDAVCPADDHGCYLRRGSQ